jgi:hypothetical protein
VIPADLVTRLDLSEEMKFDRLRNPRWELRKYAAEELRIMLAYWLIPQPSHIIGSLFCTPTTGQGFCRDVPLSEPVGQPSVSKQTFSIGHDTTSQIRRLL